MPQRQIEVKTKNGNLLVPASKSVIEIPDLAVTMTNFGSFEVTHVKSGLCLIAGFERCVNAYVAMAEMQSAFDELGIDSSKAGDEFRMEILSKDKESESLGMTIMQWLSIQAQIGSFSGEFPWESEGDSPHFKLEDLMNKLKCKSK